MAEQISICSEFLVTQPVAILRSFRKDPSGKDTKGSGNCANHRREQGVSDRHADPLE
jgi:hypothetical protein